MIGRLKDLVMCRDGTQIVSFVTRSDYAEEFDELKDADVDIEIDRHREKRSKNANNYCWVLCTKLAEKMSNNGVLVTKEEVYRDHIKEVGIYKDFNDLDPDAAKTLRTAWGMLGVGWVTEQVDFEQDGEKVVVRCYYGSSRYNRKQMTRLIDSLTQDCRALGITTLADEEIEELLRQWELQYHKNKGE